MEKRDSAVYLYLGVLVLGALFAVYLFNLQLTGFAISEQQSDNFVNGSYNNSLYNGSIIILNQTNETNISSGEYVSKVFDANNNLAVWKNLTWVGGIPSATNIAFQVTLCSNITCSDANFVAVTNVNNTINLNLTGRYLQYKAILSSNSSLITPSLAVVNLGYSVPETIVSTQLSILQPTGTITSESDIPILYGVVGNNLQCKYNVQKSDGEEVITNTTLSGCGNASFSVGSDGDYIINLYANGSSGSAFQSSAFLVSIPSTPKEKPKEKNLTNIVPPVIFVEPVVQKVADLTIQSIEKTIINPTDSKNFNLIVNNTGNLPLTACALSAGGDYYEWFSISDNLKDFAEGEEKSFAFSMNVPETATEENYTLPLSVQCSETIKNSEMVVEVVKKKIDFNITGVERTKTNRVVVTYSLAELLDEEQIVQLQFFLYDENNTEVSNTSVNQTLSAGESDEFNTNLAVNASLEGNLTLSANLNLEQYSVSVREPITLGAPTGFFVLGENLGTTGNVLAIIILIVGVVGVFFFLKRKEIFKKFGLEKEE